jgi:hypothetical protein
VVNSTASAGAAGAKIIATCEITAAFVSIDGARRSGSGVETRTAPLNLTPKDEVDIHVVVGADRERRVHVAALSHWTYDVLRGLAPHACVAAWVVMPQVTARYVAQAWVGNNAVPIDDGQVQFDALPNVLRMFPTAEAFRRQDAAGEWDLLASAVPAHAFHTGPFEVYLDATRVAALAAIFAGDAQALERILGGGADALAALTEQHWSALREAVEHLSPTAVPALVDIVLPLRLTVPCAGGSVDLEDARRVVLALVRDREKFAQAWAGALPQSAAAVASEDNADSVCAAERRYPVQRNG